MGDSRDKRLKEGGVEEDKVMGNKPRNLVDKEKLRYRVSALWIENSEGGVLLARRTYTKTHYPGRGGLQ